MQVPTKKTSLSWSLSHVSKLPNTRAVTPLPVWPDDVAPANAFSISSQNKTRRSPHAGASQFLEDLFERQWIDADDLGVREGLQRFDHPWAAVAEHERPLSVGP